MTTVADPKATPTTLDPVVDLLAAAFEGTAAVLAAAEGADHLPTPCPGWTVETVAEHIVDALGMFAAAAGADVAPTDGPRLARYRSVSAAALVAWSVPGRLDAPVELPFGTFPGRLAATINLLETYVHAGDLAVATGSDALIDGDLCDEIRRLAEAAGFDAFRQPGMFGPAVPAPDANGLAGLLAFTGRSVG